MSLALAGGAEAPARPAAAGSSFYAAMRILPRPQREAMYAIYAFCRAVDDVADGDAPRAERLAALDAWRADIGALDRGAAPPHLSALAEAVRHYGLRRDDFLAVIDGMAMDAAGDIRAPDFGTLDLYCDRVASAVGRLSVRVFGLGEADGIALAHQLGRALQLTNILRDLDEDAGLGRLYLPREALEAAGIAVAARPPAAVLADPGLGRACDWLAARARAHFAEAGRIMDRSPRRAVRAPRLMAAAYGGVLDRMTARGWAPPRRRVGVDRLRLLGAVLRYGLI